MTANSVRVRQFALAVLVGLVLLWPTARADQPPTMSRIGVLNPFGISTLEEVFRDELRQRGYIEGKNIVIDWRRPTGSEEELRSLAADLIRSKVEVIVTAGTPAAQVAMETTTTIPVVFQVGDPVASGFAVSLARPGGNGTGVSVISPELIAKRLELLPRAAREGGSQRRLPLKVVP